MLIKYKSIALKLMLRGLFSVLGVFVMQHSNAQIFEFSGNRKRQSISFKSIKNLIVIPIKINGKGPFNFILDTGVGPMIITDPTILDSLDFTLLRKINISGLGTDTLVAYLSQNITAQVGSAKMDRIPTAILRQDLFNLSGYLGIKIYGILGFNFFNSFVVDIRYSQNRLIMLGKEAKVKFNGKKTLLKIDNTKPYLFAEVTLSDSVKINAKFLIDTGASHALSMEMFNGNAFPLPKITMPAYLGMSLSGRIKGHVGRIPEIEVGGYVFKDVVSGFPDYQSISTKIEGSKRNGNLGADLLRRFNVQIDYAGGAIYFKPNSERKKQFDYNRVGAVLYLDLEKNAKRYFIAEVDENSPAERAGLLSGDEVISVNFSEVDRFSFNELSELFKSDKQHTIILEILRKGKVFFKIVQPEKRI